MKKGEHIYQQYLNILAEELRPAMGCTEPIALAYAGARARQVLGKLPEQVDIFVSGNIIKNVKSVIVPNTGGLHGIGPAVCAGIVCGDADKELEVISTVTEAQRAALKNFLDTARIDIHSAKSCLVFDIDLTLRAGADSVRLRIGPAVCAGIVAGDADKVLEVISRVSEAQKQQLHSFMQTAQIRIQPANSCLVFDIDLTLYAGEDRVRLRIINHHTNIVYVEKNGQVLQSLPITESSEDHLTDKSCLSIEKIVEFADCVDIADIEALVGNQVKCNMAIAEEGVANSWGANIGSVLLARQGQLLSKRAAAYAAAGSDARMSGCEMPVIILSGSGNQGITASVPVAVYAKELGKTREEMLRAVVLSDLVTIHQKTGIGRLSAYCGAISAGCGAGAGIAYLQGGKLHAVAHTVVNAIAILSGTICDGAKPSCAAKIAAAVDAGILGWDMYQEKQQFYGGDGIVTKGVDKTVVNVGRLAREGMKETDKTILQIMLDE